MRDDFPIPVKEALAKRVGFKCSNPNCRKHTSGPQEDTSGVINIGVAAHIKAASPGGKRFDSTQSENERGGIENGIWLCQNCGKLIDSDENRYTVNLIQKWKKISEEAALLELDSSTSQTENSSNVISYNQMGGITAHTVNISNSPPKRVLSNSSISSIVDALKILPKAVYRLHYSTGDTEALNLAKQIDEILIAIKWQKIHPIERIGGPQFPEGIQIFMLCAEEPIVTLLNGLYIALSGKGVFGQILPDLDNIFKIHGWPPVDHPSNVSGTVIFIGPNPDN